MEQFDFLKEFEETINKLPAEMKYPALVMLGNAVAEMLPKAEKEYIQSIEKMKQQFMKMFMSSIFDDDSSVN
jgi:hypothetical protein